MSTTIECIYCREDKPESAYTKVEHVLPQSFGRFRDDNMTLTIPDIRTTEVEALEVAHRRALQRLLETTNDEIWADVLRKELQRISPP